MLHKLKLICLAAGVVMICSCGASKKVESVQGELEAQQQKNAELQKELTAVRGQLSTAQDQSKAMADQNKALTTEFNNYKAECRKTEEKLNSTRQVLDEQYAQLQEIEDRIEKAMEEFAQRGVDVYYKDGLVYISMQDELLYKSGSSKLGEDGKKALASLAAVLNQYPKLNMVVVGNTDDKKFKSGAVDNWSLSTERANGVVRTLRDDYKVDPSRLTAAGKAKYAPIADNATAEGRAKNRRTEIVLNPNLEKLWGSLQQ
jgi:chemotaxis protein MotB